ncbi:MAG: CDP-alcohol phosphatidyltransferase family protein, partial [Alphaproteobacteria bacterium]
RDVLIIGGVIILFVVRLDVKMRPLIISKINTATQIGLAAVVLAELGLQLDIMGGVEVMIYLVGSTTVISGASYMVSWARQMAGIEDDGSSAK